MYLSIHTMAFKMMPLNCKIWVILTLIEPNLQIIICAYDSSSISFICNILRNPVPLLVLYNVELAHAFDSKQL